MTNDKYYVYMHVSPSGKRYIGITQNYLKRWRNGLGYWNNKYFYNAIQKYGWDNFEHIIIAENLTLHDAEKMEIELIAKYKTTDGAFGYNHAKGGKVNRGYKLSEETRKKLSESHRGLTSGFKGKSLSKEQKEKISNLLKGKYTGENSYWYGKHRSEETKEKIKKANLGISRNVGGENYWYGKHFSEEHKSKISEALTGRTFSDEHKQHLRESCIGKKFSDEHIENLKRSHKHQSKSIVQKSLDNKIIKIWDSIGDAAKTLNIDRRNITQCLIANSKNDKIHKCYGYIFEYYKGGGGVA